MKKVKNFGYFLFASALLMFFAMLFYKGFQDFLNYSSSQYIYLTCAFLVIVIYIVIGVYYNDKNEDSELNIFTLNGMIKFDALSAYFVIMFGLPFVFGVIFPLLLILVNNLYYLLILYFLLTVTIFTRVIKNNFFKIVPAVLLCLIIFLGFKARNILKVEVRITWDNEIIFN